MTVDRIIQHKHCTNCGRAMPPEKKYCSDRCETEFVTLQRNKRKALYANYIMIAALVVVLILRLV